MIWRKATEKLEYSRSGSRTQNSTDTVEIDLTVPQMVQVELLLYDPENPLQDAYPRGMKTNALLYVNFLMHKCA